MNKTYCLDKNNERRIKKYCESFGVAWDLVDYVALWDNSLTPVENLNHIKNYIENLSQNKIEGEFKVKKKTIKSEKEEQERLNLESLKKSEEIAEQEFLKVLEQTKKGEVFKEYNIPREYIKSIIKGFNRAFVFIGGAGLGKTYLTRQILVDEKAKFLENRGVNSPMALYQFLYENNDKDLILVFDDTAGLINNLNAYSILLNVLWEGFAEWNSTTERLRAPKKFLFKGKIIFITNKLTSENAEILKSRCLVYELSLNNREIIKIMYSIAQQKHDKLTKEERESIVNFIKENSNNSTRIDLRTQQKLEQLYLYDKNKWKELSVPLLNKDDELELLISCITSANSVKQAQQEWCDQTGESRRKFFYLKKKVF